MAEACGASPPGLGALKAFEDVLIGWECVADPDIWRIFFFPPFLQVPSDVPEGHCPQNVRSRGAGFHISQLHHYSTGAPRHRPTQHGEYLSRRLP